MRVIGLAGLERRRQDDPRREAHPRAEPTRPLRLDGEARPPRLRDRPAGQGLLRAPPRRGERGSGVLRPALGARSRTARRGRAVPRRSPAPALARRPRDRRGFQGRPHPEDRGVSGGERQAAALRSGAERARDRRPTFRCRRARCPFSTSTTCRASPSGIGCPRRWTRRSRRSRHGFGRSPSSPVPA